MCGLSIEGAAAHDAGSVLTFAQDSNMAGVSSKGHVHRLSIDDLVLEVVVLAAAQDSSNRNLSRMQEAMSQRGAAL